MTSTSAQRVVVTGRGAIAPGAASVDELLRHLAAGRSSVAPITRFDASTYSTRIAAEAPDPARPPGVDAALWEASSRIERLAFVVAAAALVDAGLAVTPGVSDADAAGAPAVAPAVARRGLVLAAGLGSFALPEIAVACAAAGPDGFDAARYAEVLAATLAPRAVERRSPGNLAARIAIELRLGGPLLAVDTACAAGSQAIGDALRWLRLGLADAVVVVGADSQLAPLGLASFCLLRALSTRNDDPARASRPFAAGRDGFVMGEGAGALVLETLVGAERRGARIHGEVAGFGAACDAWRITDPHPDGLGAVLSMRRALADAGAAVEEVGYVNAHGTSTPANDRIETRALHTVFGVRAERVPVSSTKSMLGHLTVAAGVVEAIATLGMLRDGLLHPTINLEATDPECDLDYVPHVARRAEVELALSSSFGFGGQCACVALRRWS